MTQKIAEEHKKIIDDAWLNVVFNESTLFNPLARIPLECEDSPHEYVLWLLQQPEYFQFVCKEILNIQILPFQSVILREMWGRKFPMLIGARGSSKMLKEDELIRVVDGWREIRHIEVGDKVYGGDGKLTTVINKSEYQKDLEFYRITLRDGRSIECCEDHQWLVWIKDRNKEKGVLKWSTVSTKDMLKGYSRKRIGKKSNGIEYQYALPINKALEQKEKKYDLHPYIVGVLLGDGCLTQKTITISTMDLEIIEKVRRLLPEGYKIKYQESSVCTYGISKKDKSVDPFYKICKKIGIWQHNAKTKFIPEEYKYGSYDQRMELIRGMLDTDGTATQSKISYCTISNRLADDFLGVVRSLGLHCKKHIYESWYNSKRYNDCNKITIYTNLSVFSLSRKLNLIKQNKSKHDKVFITNIEHIGKRSGYCIMVDNEDHTYITKDYIVTHNSFLLALYALLRILFLPERKVLICGSAFRQSKVVFNYMETIWGNAPLLRDLCGQSAGPRHEPDMFRFHIGNSMAIAIPVGNGDRIRGLRANDIIADEFAAQSRDVFENVIAGFAAVKSSPVESVRDRASRLATKTMGYFEAARRPDEFDNQMILSGTAFYDFNHFATYWKRWRQIIKSKGNPEKLREVFPEGVPDGFDYRHFSIIRLPVELLPKGFMDESMVARSKATIHNGIFLMEFSAVFSTDSNGFFKRSLIESCVLSNNNEITLPSGPVNFTASLKGRQDKQYIYGIDPASEVDNFSIVILEHYEDHRRIVHTWTTNAKEHKERVKAGLCNETDFYSYCARKIRDLMRVFPCIRIAMDSQGGGVAVREALHDIDKIQDGELPIWPIIESGKPADTDGEPGLHLIEMINFSSAEWTSEANHGLRKDFEDRVCIFPYFDNVSLGLAEIADEKGGKLYDTLEDCLMEIEELKNELSTIVITQTTTGRDKWSTPEVKLPGNKKGYLRKDRYSALVMANMVSRQMARNPEKYFLTSFGGFAGIVQGRGEKEYVGPSWLVGGLSEIYD